MAKKKPQSTDADPLFRQPPPAPDFAALLASPLVRIPLPTNFNAEEEKTHLVALWEENAHFRRYSFSAFVHAGGSGMVFKVKRDDSPTTWAMKIVRAKLYHAKLGTSTEVATTLSPVSEDEIKALQRLSHPHVVHLFDALENQRGVYAICTSYVENPKGLDEYLRETLQQSPSARAGIEPFSPQRLDRACCFLIEKCQEIASAMQHMHGERIFHFDIKPNNILVSGDQKPRPAAMLTDMGACIHADDLAPGHKTRVHFTWTYAHPDLTSIVNDPASITGGGLKASATISADTDLAKYDLFAYGKTLQELLAVLEAEFGERSYASYAFRYLHVIACLLLDGNNAPGSGIVKRDGRRFVPDVALEYPPEIFARHRIKTAVELAERLERFSPKYSRSHLAPELDSWQPDVINSVVHSPAPFSARVSTIFNHPCFRRLKTEPQLGWVREVFPGATHDRWSHSLGVFSGITAYFNSLLSDPEVPSFRILVDSRDVEHGFVAAILHDLGQTAFGHDFEEACPYLFSHDKIVGRLLKEPYWGRPTLEEAIQRMWPDINMPRVLAILGQHKPGASNIVQAPGESVLRAVDGVAADAINGPIDADKLDYLLRDSIACGVPYGHGMDIDRFLRALTVTATTGPGGARLALGYKAKGRAAVASILLARYQMWGAIYWHHTFRCIQAMFVHAASSTFGDKWDGAKEFRLGKLPVAAVIELLYSRLICGKTWKDAARAAKVNPGLANEPPTSVRSERALEFLWQFAADPIRKMIEDLAERKVYKRIFEMRLGELGDRADYSGMKQELSPINRVRKASALKEMLLNTVLNSMRERGPTESSTEDAARERLQYLAKSPEPLLVMDFPVRGISQELNMPKELGDAVRKYFVIPRGQSSAEDNVFHVVRKLQEHMATVRVFVAPDFHELIIRYLDQQKIHDCVSSVIPAVTAKR
jgi:serine/threonine protein kinase